MKTLQGIELEGELLNLYRYHFAPDGGAVEADLMAQAVDLQEDLKLLITLQKQGVRAVMTLCESAIKHDLGVWATLKIGLPYDMINFYWQEPLTADDIVRHHSINNEYVFPYMCCSLRVFSSFDKEQPDVFGDAPNCDILRDDCNCKGYTTFIPLDSDVFPEHLKTHPYYLKAAQAMKFAVAQILLNLSAYVRVIDYTQILIKTNHPLLGTLDHTILQ